MKLYYSKASCSLVIRIILNEIGVTFAEEAVDLKTKTYKNGENFRTINPKGSVPVLELDNGEILTENAVILQYLANTNQAHTLLPASEDFAHYRVLEWLNYITTELHKGFSPLFNPTVPENIKDEIFKPLLKTKFAFINQHLANHTYLHGNHFTLPDAYLYVITRWAIAHHIALHDLPQLAKYIAMLSQRKSIVQSLEQEQLPIVLID